MSGGPAVGHVEQIAVPPNLLELIRSRSSFHIISHVEPDGDCVATSLALRAFLRRLGKRADCYNPGPFDRAEIRDFEGEFQKQLPARDFAPDEAAIVVDCSSEDRIGGIAEQLGSLTIAVVDHHIAGEPFGDIRYVDPTLPSATLLVQRIIEEMSLAPTEEEARHIFFGFITDTGFFRFLDAGTGDVFALVARLVDAGASPRDQYLQLNGGRPLASRYLIGKLLDRLEDHYNGRLLLAVERKEDTERAGRKNRDTDAFYRLLLATEGVEVVALIREESEDSCTGSLRSRDTVDVSAVAHSLGGGGHRRASGFLAQRPAAEVREELIIRIGRALAEAELL